MVRRLLASLIALAASAATAATAATAAADPAPIVPPPPPGVVSGRFVLPDRPPWAGEVFTLGLVWEVDWDLFRYLEGDLGWTPDPLVIEGWTRAPLGQPRPLAGRTVADLGFTTRAVSLAPGSITLQPATQQLQIVTGAYETSGVTIATIGPVLARSARATPKIRPLPPAPPTFSGAVGAFVLASTFDKSSPEVGKPMVWTVTLSGTGNWPGFGGVPSRPLPRAFDVVGKPRQSGATSSLFERSVAESITIVPRTAGSFTLGPVEMTIFDPQAGRYRTIAAPAVALVIKPGAASSRQPAYTPEPETAPPDARLPPALTGVGHARAPLPRRVWSTMLLLPGVTLALLWLGLATHCAVVTDPDRAARRADARLRRTLSILASGPNEPLRRKLVRDWQRDAGIRLNVGHAAPTPGIVREADWAQLWDEADRHLYGVDMPLPADWPTRAGAALAERGGPPRFAVRRILAPANLCPMAAVLLVVLASLPAPLGAADQSRRSTAAALDWVGQYNRGRAAAEASNWPMAAAHAGIAWVQAPRSAETTALWTLAAREAGVAGRAAGGLPVPNDRRGQLTGLLPPLGWQWVALAGALLVVGGYGTLLLVGFGHVPRAAMLFGVAAAGIGTIGGGIGWAGVACYGASAAPDAAITWRQVALRPLPVETPEPDAILVLAPGTVGHRDAGFLGWSHLTLADGRAGWVRRRELVPVWGP